MNKKVFKNKYGGEIVLKNIGPGYARKIKAIMDEIAESSEVEEEFPDETPQPKVEEKVNLPYVAVSTFKTGNDWYVVQVKYDPVSMKAEISSVKNVGLEKAYAIEAFKILVVDNNLI